jgi:glycosyltransferase involved in cell wall biosynthesis
VTAETLGVRVLSQLDPSIARTNSIADIRLCMGLASAGLSVELVVPTASSAPEPPERLFDLYDIRQSFAVRYLATPSGASERRRVLGLVGRHSARAAAQRGSLAVVSRDVRLLVPYLAAGRLPSRASLVMPWLHELRDRPLDRWICRRASGVLATNSAILGGLGALGVERESTFVTGNPVPDQRLQFGRTCSRGEARSAISLDRSGPIVAYTGKLFAGMRELDYLLAAARRLPDHQFVLTGGRPAVIERLEAQLRADGIRNVHLAGLLERPEDVRFYQQAADVLVSYYSKADHPYAHHNLPNKLAEYMTTGNPIVAADFPAVRDLLNDANSVLVSPDDPDSLVRGILTALGDDEVARNRPIRAQEEIAGQTCEAVGERLGRFLRGRAERRAGPYATSSELRRRNVASVISNETIALELASFLERHFGSRGPRALLDLGAGTKPYAPIYEPYFSDCTSVDVEYSPHDIARVDRIASADDLPFGAASFDCVVCTEVLEHCRQPDLVLREISRVLRPDGRLFLTTPLLRPLHEMPHDYFRFTPSSLRFLAESADLSVEQIVPRGDYAALLLLTLQLPLTKVLQRLSRLAGRSFYNYSNPLVYGTVVAPQLGYLALWRKARGQPEGALGRAHEKLSYYALGYVSTFHKEPDVPR